MPDLSTKAESTLSAKTDVNKTDSVRLVGTDDHSYKSSVGDLAKCVLEECNVSSLAGATQTPKAAIDALNSNLSNKADFLVVSSTGGHNSDTAKTALRTAVDSLSTGAVRIGRLSAGDLGLILVLKGSDNYAVIFYFSYSSTTVKGVIKSMSKYNGTWGDWVSISP